MSHTNFTQEVIKIIALVIFWLVVLWVFTVPNTVRYSYQAKIGIIIFILLIFITPLCSRFKKKKHHYYDDQDKKEKKHYENVVNIHEEHHKKEKKHYEHKKEKECAKGDCEEFVVHI